MRLFMVLLFSRGTQGTPAFRKAPHPSGGLFVFRTMKLSLQLPTPHQAQVGPINSQASRRVLNCGRRAGKTEFLASFETVPRFLGFTIQMIQKNGRFTPKKVKTNKTARILYGAPSDDQTSNYWEICCKHLHDLIRGGFIYRNNTKRILEWVAGGNGRIRARTAYDADSWRGDWGNLLLFDEWAYTDPDAWELVGMPMLLDKGGSAVFCSTPLRKNHHFLYYQRGLDPHQDRWESFKFSSLDNPHLDEQALKELTEDMTDENFRQEILAEFLENEGAVFRNIDACMNAPLGGDHDGHSIIAGIDWGKHNDFTVISIGCLTCRQELHLDRFNKIDYAFQRDRLETAVNQYNVKDGLAELNSIGEPNLEDLQNRGLPLRGFNTTATSKRPLIQGLALVLEREDWQFINDPVAKGELEAYELKMNANTGAITYSAPSGVHDDTVIARALMIRAANSYMPAFL